MNILVFGASGLLGAAIVRACRAAGHTVQTAGRSGCDHRLDSQALPPTDELRALLHGSHVVINATGILMERGGNRFDAVHRVAPMALLQAAQEARVARFIHISASGVGCGIPGAYMASKAAGEQALGAQRAHGPTDVVIVRPALLMDADCPSTRLFRALARSPVLALPGLRAPGGSLLAPVAVGDVAQCVLSIAQSHRALQRVVALAGPEVMAYRDMLAQYRQSRGRPAAWGLPLPWWLLQASAWVAGWLPQKVLSLDTVRLLRAGVLAVPNELARWLGRRPPQTLSQVLAQAAQQEASRLIALG